MNKRMNFFNKILSKYKYFLFIFNSSFLLTFNLFSHEGHVDQNDIKINFNIDNSINKYDLIIDHKNGISQVLFNIHKCKECTSTDINYQIICDKNKNIFLQEVICKSPQSAMRNNIATGSISRMELSCKKKIDRFTCTSNVITARDMNASYDINAFTKLGNLDLEYVINDKDMIENNRHDSIDNNSSKDVKVNKTSKLEIVKSRCRELGLEEKTEKFADCVLRFY